VDFRIFQISIPDSPRVFKLRASTYETGTKKTPPNYYYYFGRVVINRRLNNSPTLMINSPTLAAVSWIRALRAHSAVVTENAVITACGNWIEAIEVALFGQLLPHFRWIFRRFR
jgi:hypothetical protein